MAEIRKRFFWCCVYHSSLSDHSSYRVQKNRKYYAVKVLEDNNNLLILRKEIAFQMRSNCPNIVDVFETYYFNDKLWVSSFSFL